MITTNSLRGRVALMVGHCAGMVDLVALPVWVGTLISVYRFDPQQAGLLATLFLAGAVAASLVLAPFFQQLRGRSVATVGFACAAVAFAAASSTHQFALLALLHAVAGVAAGAALSVTHGTIARSQNPHRLFALVGMALGVFAIVFLGGTPVLVAQQGGSVLFQVFAGVMAVGAVVAAVAFPAPDMAGGAERSRTPAIPHTTMNDDKNIRPDSNELDDDQLENVAGGAGTEWGDPAAWPPSEDGRTGGCTPTVSPW